MEKLHYQNQQINYLKEQQEINKYLIFIKELGKDTSRIELALTKINEELEEELKQVYQDMNVEELMENPIKGGRIEWCYLNAIEKLSKIKKIIINEYNTDIAINSSIEELEINIKTLTEKNLKKTIELLSNTMSLISSISDDNIKDKSLLDKFYGLTYQLIKLELIYTNNSTLLDTILKSEVSTINVEKYLLEEIHSLDLTKAENEPIRKRYNELKTMTLNNHFLDYELLNLLKFHHNKKYLSDLKEELLKKSTSLEKQQQEIEKKTKRKSILQQEIEKTRLSKKQNRKTIIKYRTFITTQAILVLTTLLGAAVLAKKLATLKYIPKYITTYDVNKNEINTEKTEKRFGWSIFENAYEDNRKLQQFNPWYDKEIAENGFLSHKYYQEILTYDLNDIYYDNIKDYANINLEDYTPSRTEKEQDCIPIEDLYQEPQYIITEVHYDKENIYPRLNASLYLILLALSEMIAARLDSFFFKDPRETNMMRHAKITQEKLLKLEKELAELNKSLSILTNDYESLQTEISKDLKYLPESESKNKELHKVRKKIKEVSLPENNSNEIKN